jgi:hypothetical protein
MTSQITISSGSVLGFYGDPLDLISALGIENQEGIEAVLDNFENFPLPSIEQKTVIPGETNRLYEGQIDSTDISYTVYRNGTGEISVLVIDGGLGFGGNYIYLPGTQLKIPGSDVGGVNGIDDIIVILQPDAGLIFDTDSDYAILNSKFYEDLNISDYGVKAQLMSNTYSKVGESFEIGSRFSYEFNTLESSLEGCDFPPYNCNVNVNTFCVRDFYYAWSGCNFSVFPLVNTGNGRNFRGAWRDCVNLSSSPDADILLRPSDYFVAFYSEAIDGPVTLEIIIQPDEYPGEVSWFLTKNSTVLASGGVNGGEVSLSEPGDYVFDMRDSFGDGGGPYELILGGIKIYESSGAYGDGELVPFTLSGFSSFIAISNQRLNFLPLDPVNLTNSSSVLSEANKRYEFFLITEDKESLSVTVVRGASGEVSSILFVSLNYVGTAPEGEEDKDRYVVGDLILIQGSLVGGQNGVDDIEIEFVEDSIKVINLGLESYSFPTINTGKGIDFFSTWRNCESLVHFPPLNFNRGLNFSSAWKDCSDLNTFPPNMFDSCEASDFSFAWQGCSLDQKSVNSILESLDESGVINGVVHLNSGFNSPPGPQGLSAVNNLLIKNWSVYFNSSL